VLWLELKRAKLGRRSVEQIAFAEHLARHGHDYVCASSYAEAVAALCARGIIKAVRVQ
jgi:hypothetical protein